MLIGIYYSMQLIKTIFYLSFSLKIFKFLVLHCERQSAINSAYAACMHDIGATSYVFTPFSGWYFIEYSEASMACKINQKYYSITT